MNDDFLTSTYAQGGVLPDSVTDFADKWVGGNAVFALGIIIVLAIMVIWLMSTREKFNPGHTMNFQMFDGTGQYSPYDHGREHLDAAPAGRDASAFAQQVQTPGKTFTIDPNALPNQPGSLGWQITHSDDFGCGKSGTATDAWTWMTGVVSENMNGRPRTDNDFSKVLTGNT
jgi:hypothetical protein